MGVTRFTGLSVDRVAGQGGGTFGLTGPLTVNGTVLFTGAKSHTLKGKVTVSGTTVASGTLVVTGGKASRMMGRMTFTGSVTITGGGARLRLRTNGTGANAGIRTIATGGSAVITTTKLTSSSVLLLTPLLNTGLRGIVHENYSVRSGAAGTFKIHLKTPVGATAATGRIAWLIVN